MVDNNCIIEGNVKFRDGKKWKSRWCVMRKLSPVADCLHLQLYADSKDRYKQGQTKASLSLQHFLGVESGFTLDKESNTIAIICQDVTVVLAFDTRERLIQWQVKISNNLGEDQQFLILISTAPSKTKLSNGPAHLHIQDRRFCLTVGIPPRLVGIWDIGHLRRYGVVEGRFCFEGGSRCGRGEGLHVLITDQGEDIVKTLQLAGDGKLSSRKRPQEARQFSRSETRASDLFPLTVCSSNFEDRCDGCKPESPACWSSTESRQHQESDYASRETISVSELPEQPVEWRSYSLRRQMPATLERCSSCIDKLATVSKSTILNSTSNQPRTLDRLSLSSYSSHDSDYSGSQRMDCSKSSQITDCGKAGLPPRPPKPHQTSKRIRKAPMPLPGEQKPPSYENYDVPKAILSHHVLLEQPVSMDRHYDTPRKIKECLALPKNYPNYDTPQVPQAVVLQQCGCPAKLQTVQSPRSSVCPCQNVMSWAGFVLPYCRRGAGIEATGVTVQPVKLSGEGKMPVVNASGEIAIYSTLKREDTESNPKDETPVRPIKLSGEGKMPVVNASGEIGVYSTIKSEDVESDTKDQAPGVISKDYENVEPLTDTGLETKDYVNIDFTESLGHYENSKDLLSKIHVSQEDLEKLTEDVKEVDDPEDSKICQKCGHAKETDYLMMDLERQQSSKKPFPGYLAMQPACPKEILSRICSVKSSSNPTLYGNFSADVSKKRCDSEYRVPGSAMLSSPYLRRRYLESGNSDANSVLLRKRSYSAESARYLDDENRSFPSNLTIHKCSSEADKGSLLSPEHRISTESKANQTQQSFIKIRRSSSVPSKTGHNRDSSSSNDSGVSTGSLSHRTGEFVEFETVTGRKNVLAVYRKSPPPTCYHGSLPRKSKSSDPLRELSFQFQKIKVPTKSSSAEADIPGCTPKKGFGSPGEPSTAPYIDSRSTSSGTSDMSDYIETLSLSSHSSSDTPDSLRLGGRAVATTLRPRSGKEYYKIDRSILVEQGRGQSANYANITPVLEKSESPSPGYMSSSPFEQPQPTREHFLFPEVNNVVCKIMGDI
ncbi:hypothetical protein KM043_004714 [Ampulex compressa]|nr:hypothetical protein KM043_004714 [Ampulex compressa]